MAKVAARVLYRFRDIVIANRDFFVNRLYVQ